jgi:hydroxyacylglutathione hydrolase
MQNNIKEFLYGDYKIITIVNGSLKENCYIIKHLLSNHLIIIDPGSNEESIISTIESEGSQVKYLLITHAHYDHVGALKAICNKFNIFFKIHEKDLKLYKRAPLYSISMVKKQLEISDKYSIITEFILNDWDGHDISIIHTPGHTPGSVCYKINDLLFSGDLILLEHESSFELPGANKEEHTESILNVLKKYNNLTFLFPGHGKPIIYNSLKDMYKIN